MPSRCPDGLVVFFAFCSFFLVVFLGQRDLLAVTIDGGTCGKTLSGPGSLSRIK